MTLSATFDSMYASDNSINPMRYNFYTISMAGAVILKICYGYTVAKEGNDPLVVLAGKTLDEFNLAFQPGAFMLDFIPWRKWFFFNQSERLTTYAIHIKSNTSHLGSLVQVSKS
jgi:hypothetical protein